MGVGALVEKEALGMARDVVVGILRGLEVDVVVVSHEFSVVGDGVEGREVQPISEIVVEFEVPVVDELFFEEGVGEGFDIFGDFVFELGGVLLTGELVVGETVADQNTWILK